MFERKTLGWIAAGALIAAAGAAWFLYKKEKDRELDELDSWLMDTDEAEEEGSELKDEDQDGPEVIYVRSDPNESLSADAAEWKSLAEDDEVDIEFLLPDAASLKAFQDELARSGYSSRIDSDGLAATVILTGPMSEEEVMEFTFLLQRAMKESGAVYQGFIFN